VPALETTSNQTRDDDAAMNRDLEMLAEILPSYAGRPYSSIENIPAGLGTRRFYRIHFEDGAPESLVARVEPQTEIRGQADEGFDVNGDPSLPAGPTWLPEPPLEPLRQFLEDAGLRVPYSVAHLPEQGVDLLEDVGARTLMHVDEPERSRRYREACLLVPRLQKLSTSPERIPAFGRIFDRKLIDTKAWKWLHWTIPGLLDRPATQEESHSFHELVEGLSGLLDDAPRRLAHRDFKAENLHLVPPANASGSAAAQDECELVMIDVQGAFMAPPEYDLVCLLYDLQLDLDENFAMECFRSTLADLPDSPDPTLAALRFDAIATLRLCKDISHLVHARHSRNDARRWHEIPRGLTLLERAMGRLARTFPEARTLTSVIHALTLAAGSSDSG
jgi:aminoglycoside/choline kinase family phosphotransferase